MDTWDNYNSIHNSILFSVLSNKLRFIHTLLLLDHILAQKQKHTYVLRASCLALYKNTGNSRLGLHNNAYIVFGGF